MCGGLQKGSRSRHLGMLLQHTSVCNTTLGNITMSDKALEEELNNCYTTTAACPQAVSAALPASQYAAQQRVLNALWCVLLHRHHC
jgi:hypothetical protein